VYVLGSQTVVTARPSLGEAVLEAEQGVQQLPRISCVSVFGKQMQQQRQCEQQQQQAAAAACCQQEQSSGSREGQCCSSPKRQQLQQPQPAPASPGLAAVAASWRPPATAACPPEWVTSSLAATLRRELGMQLFNFDLLVPEQQAQQGQGQQEGDAPPLCYVVDINYFPGVDKIVDFERRFVKLLWEGERR
jgi:inositol-1,3,4-trisphosphate 5/6-kinase/inositol-tetrakisphosphate 1-kinase